MSEQYQIGHLSVESPWGNAGGVIKTPEDVELMARTGVGWIEAGSYTLEPRVGHSPNGERVYWHNSATGETANSLDMPNRGFDIIERQIPEMTEIANAYGKPLLVNIAPVSDDPVSETRELIDRAYGAGADAVLLNAGCPNVITPDGDRHETLSSDMFAFNVVLASLSDIVNRYGKKIFVRTSPLATYHDVQDIMLVVRRTDVVSAVFTPNTWPGFQPSHSDGFGLEVPGNSGGRSGPATAHEAYLQTMWALDALRNSRIDVVSSGGIMKGRELRTRMAIGAVAGAGTTFYYESAEEGWSEATDRLLREFAETD